MKRQPVSDFAPKEIPSLRALARAIWLKALAPIYCFLARARRVCGVPFLGYAALSRGRREVAFEARGHVSGPEFGMRPHALLPLRRCNSQAAVGGGEI